MRHLGLAAAAALALAACDSEERTTADVETLHPGEATPPLAAPIAEPPTTRETAREPAGTKGDMLGASSIAALSVSPAAPGERIDLSAQIDQLERERREALGLEAAEFAAADLGAGAAAGAGALTAETPPVAFESGPGGSAGAEPEAAREGERLAQAEGRPGEDAPDAAPLAEGVRATEPETAMDAVSEAGRPEVEADGVRNDAEGRISQTAGENELPTTEMSVDSENAGEAAQVNPETTPMVSPSARDSDGLLPRADDAEMVDTRPPAETRAFVNSEGTFGTETSGRKAEGQMDAQRRATAEGAGGPGGLMPSQAEPEEKTGVAATPLTLSPEAGGSSDGAAGGAGQGAPSGEAAAQDGRVAMDPAAAPGAVGRLDSPAQQMSEREAPGEAVLSGGGGSGSGLVEPMRAALDSLQAIHERLNELEGEAAETEAVRQMRGELQTAAEALIHAAGRAGVPLDQLAQP